MPVHKQRYTDIVNELINQIILKYITTSEKSPEIEQKLPKPMFQAEIHEYNIIIPLLSPHQLTSSDIEWISTNFPEVIDFLYNTKNNKDVCCKFNIHIADDSTFTIDIEKVESFYQDNKNYLRDIIVGCLIEEMLFGHIPVIHFSHIDRYRFRPVQSLKSTVVITRYGTILVYSIDQYGRGMNIQLSPMLDLDVLLSSKLFQFHQYVVASLIQFN